LPRPSPICSSPVTSRGLSHVVLSFNFGFLTDVLMHHVIPGIAYSVPLNLDVKIDFIRWLCACVLLELELNIRWAYCLYSFYMWLYIFAIQLPKVKMCL